METQVHQEKQELLAEKNHKNQWFCKTVLWQRTEY
jgi:hypothetical protein